MHESNRKTNAPRLTGVANTVVQNEQQAMLEAHARAPAQCMTTVCRRVQAPLWDALQNVRH